MKNNLYDKILKEYEVRRADSEREANNKIVEIYEKLPIIEEIDRLIKKTAIDASLKIIKGDDVDISEELEELRCAKIAQLLNYGYPEDYLLPKRSCTKCGDTGFVDGGECACLKQRLASEYYKMSNLDKVLSKENFSTFDFEVFSDEEDPEEGISPRERMLLIFDAANEFIEEFEDEEVDNLLFYGATGLGKTFMLNCIAKSLLDSGYTVVYQTAYNIMGITEEYKFNKAENMREAKNKYDYLLEADLLIIDDLGTESTNTFTITELFNIISTRNLNKKKMLISTNLSPADIAKTYTDRILSRIVDRFKLLEFIGEDLRWR